MMKQPPAAVVVLFYKKWYRYYDGTISFYLKHIQHVLTEMAPFQLSGTVWHLFILKKEPASALDFTGFVAIGTIYTIFFQTFYILHKICLLHIYNI